MLFLVFPFHCLSFLFNLSFPTKYTNTINATENFPWEEKKNVFVFIRFVFGWPMLSGKKLWGLILNSVEFIL